MRFIQNRTYGNTNIKRVYDRLLISGFKLASGEGKRLIVRYIGSDSLFVEGWLQMFTSVKRAIITKIWTLMLMKSGLPQYNSCRTWIGNYNWQCTLPQLLYGKTQTLASRKTQTGWKTKI